MHPAMLPAKFDELPDNRTMLIPTTGGKDARSRLTKFAAYLTQTGGVWFAPDLAAYREYLLSHLSPTSAQAHLSTIRGQYRRLLRQRDLFYALLPDTIEGAANRKAAVDELITRLDHALSAEALSIPTITQQDRADSQELRLSKGQAHALIRAPLVNYGADNPKALRDTALIALMLATGIREDECVKLVIADLRQKLDGRLALRVREGKGLKQRLIPYGVNSGVLMLVERWLELAGITEETDPVFQAFGSRAHAVRELKGQPLTTRSLQNILKDYPIEIDGKLTQVRPHDLRRTYARREHDAGTVTTAIQQNLGHVKIETTLRYIGQLDAGQRESRAAYDWMEFISQAQESLVGTLFSESP